VSDTQIEFHSRGEFELHVDREYGAPALDQLHQQPSSGQHQRAVLLLQEASGDV